MGLQRERGNILLDCQFAARAISRFGGTRYADAAEFWRTHNILRQRFGDFITGSRTRKVCPGNGDRLLANFSSASVSKGLGTGKYDHQIRLYVSKIFLGSTLISIRLIFPGGDRHPAERTKNAEMTWHFASDLQETAVHCELYGDMHFNNGDARLCQRAVGAAYA